MCVCSCARSLVALACLLGACSFICWYDGAYTCELPLDVSPAWMLVLVCCGLVSSLILFRLDASVASMLNNVVAPFYYMFLSAHSGLPARMWRLMLVRVCDAAQVCMLYCVVLWRVGCASNERVLVIAIVCCVRMCIVVITRYSQFQMIATAVVCLFSHVLLLVESLQY